MSDQDAIKTRRDAVMKLTFALAKDGEKAFRMSIPLQQDDSDVLLMKLCADVDTLLAERDALLRFGVEQEQAAQSLREAAGCAFDAIDISGASEETAREARNILGPALTAYDRSAGLTTEAASR